MISRFLWVRQWEFRFIRGAKKIVRKEKAGAVPVQIRFRDGGAVVTASAGCGPGAGAAVGEACCCRSRSFGCTLEGDMNRIAFCLVTATLLAGFGIARDGVSKLGQESEIEETPFQFAEPVSLRGADLRGENMKWTPISGQVC